MKTNKTIYWITTGIVCSIMGFSAINNLSHPFGPFERPFVHLGLPDYLRIELSLAKALGVLAVLIPGVPRKVKEFAYFGFGITLISASIPHFAVGDGIMFFGTLIVSYWYFNKSTDEALSRSRLQQKVPSSVFTSVSRSA